MFRFVLDLFSPSEARIAENISGILDVLSTAPFEELSIIQLMDAVKEKLGKELLGFGYLYPLLLQLEREGKITSRWENPIKSTFSKKPRRRLYRLASSLN